MSCPSAVAPTAPLPLSMRIPSLQTCVMSLPEGRRTTPDIGGVQGYIRLWTPDIGYETVLEACLLLVVKAAGSSPSTVFPAPKVSLLLTTNREKNRGSRFEISSFRKPIYSPQVCEARSRRHCVSHWVWSSG